MTLILELPDDKEVALKAKARLQGVSAEYYAVQVLNRDLEEPATMLAHPLPSIAHLQKTDPRNGRGSSTPGRKAMIQIFPFSPTKP